MSHSSLIKVEPYWNVKYPVQLHRTIYPLIKVEPYWNVKPEVFPSIVKNASPLK